MGVMSGYMLSVPKYLASYSRSAGISCLICSLVVFLAHFFFLNMLFDLKDLEETDYYCPECKEMSNYEPSPSQKWQSKVR